MVRCSNCGAFKDAGAKCSSCGHVPIVGEAPVRCKRCGIPYSSGLYREPYCSDCTKKVERHRDRVENVAALIVGGIVVQQISAWGRAGLEHPLDTLDRWATGDGAGRLRNKSFGVAVKVAEQFINYYDGIELDVGSVKPKEEPDGEDKKTVG